MLTDLPEEKDMNTNIGKINPDEQTTTADTGWSEQQKTAMRDAGYDDMDMIQAWYS